jgi:hypothetical protein
MLERSHSFENESHVHQRRSDDDQKDAHVAHIVAQPRAFPTLRSSFTPSSRAIVLAFESTAGGAASQGSTSVVSRLRAIAAASGYRLLPSRRQAQTARHTEGAAAESCSLNNQLKPHSTERR